MRLPSDSQHISIIGSNGSGKTQAALWHLSERSYTAKPWIIYNFKRDESIDDIPGARFIGTDIVPTSPGVYVVHPYPDEQLEVENQMWAIWERGNTGVYVDEGYMIGRHNGAFRALLTQGRSKRIPMMVLSQRPVWMDKFVFSESQFFQVFRLQSSDDIKSIMKFVPADLTKRLPDYCSYYYDVGDNKLSKLSPVPDIDSIHATFAKRLKNQKLAV